MRVCLISEFFYPDNTGGTGTVLSGLVRQLRERYGSDIEIDVVTSRHVYRGGEELLPVQQEWNGVSIYRVEAPRSTALSIKKRLLANARLSAAVLRRMMRLHRERGGYDLVVVSTAPPTMPMAAQAFKRLTGTPYAYVVYDLYPDVATALGVLPKNSKPARALHSLQRSWLHGADRVVVLGRCMADHLTANYGLPGEKIEVAPVGADARQVSPHPTETRFRQANKLSGFVVLWAGNFGCHQNFDAILDAARLLRDSHPCITFAFVGNGAKKDHISGRIERENLHNAQMFPFVDEADFSDMMSSSDVSLVALEPGAEGLGVPSKFYNILASGRPTVALVAPSSEVARVLAEHDCGVRSEQNGEELAALIAGLAQSPETLERMGQNARRVLEERYSTERIAEQFYKMMAQMVPETRSQGVSSASASTAGLIPPLARPAILRPAPAWTGVERRRTPRRPKNSFWSPSISASTAYEEQRIDMRHHSSEPAS